MKQPPFPSWMVLWRCGRSLGASTDVQLQDSCRRSTSRIVPSARPRRRPIVSGLGHPAAARGVAATEPTLLSRPFAAVLCPTARDSMWELSLRELSSRRRNTITHLCVAVPIRFRVFFLQQLLACTESAELHAGGSRATGSRCTRLLLQRCVTTPCP